MKFICSCRSSIDMEYAAALDLKWHNFSVEIEATSRDEAFAVFIKDYIQDLDISDSDVTISVESK